LVKKAKTRPQSPPLAGRNLEMGRKLLILLIQGFAPKGACLHTAHSFSTKILPLKGFLNSNWELLSLFKFAMPQELRNSKNGFME
jgi:hypothetical protein